MNSNIVGIRSVDIGIGFEDHYTYDNPALLMVQRHVLVYAYHHFFLSMTAVEGCLQISWIEEKVLVKS